MTEATEVSEVAATQPPPGPPPSLRDLGIENYEMVTVRRSALKNAPYNPRNLTESAKRKLKKGLARHGLVAPITFNVRTGHIVGGHQRLSLVDALAGVAEYDLSVAQIDVDEAREKELNLLLNNSQAMGEWDFESLGVMVTDKALNLDGTGFEADDIFKLLGDSGAEAMADRKDGTLDALAQRLQEVAAQYDQVTANSAKRDGIEYFLIFVFRDPADCTDFIERAGLPDNRYQSGNDLRRLTGLPEGGQEKGGSEKPPDDASAVQ